MKWFAHLKVGTKLALSFAAVLVLTVFIGVFSMIQLGKVNQTATDFGEDWMPSVRLVLELKSQIARIRTRELQYILSKDPADWDKYDKVIAADLVDLKKIEDDYTKLTLGSEERALYDGFLKMWTGYMGEQAKVIALVREGKEDEARAAIRGESNKLIVALRGQLDKLAKLYVDGGAQASKDGQKIYDNSLTLVGGLLIFSVLLGIVTAFMMTRSLVKQLGGEPEYAAEVAQKIASGDLTAKIALASNDRGSLLFAMNAMRDSLARTVAEVRASTDAIAAASRQVASDNADLSSRTEQQAASVEETAASMEEMLSTVTNNAENAVQANGLTVSASDVAVKGGAVVAEVVHTMGSINESSRKIVDIIAVIDGIAFQTNILALNAAVEAARAGEQGRGFAVVATEVRNLAQRSAAAAKEIKQLIDDSVEKVEAGSKLVDQAGATIGEVVSSVKRVTDIVGEITMASQEQSTGIQQVSQAMRHMDEMTQKNAALVEEAAATSDTLMTQADRLAQAVSVFKLDDRYQAAQQATPAAVPKAVQVKASHPKMQQSKLASPRKPVLGNARTKLKAIA